MSTAVSISFDLNRPVDWYYAHIVIGCGLLFITLQTYYKLNACPVYAYPDSTTITRPLELSKGQVIDKLYSAGLR